MNRRPILLGALILLGLLLFFAIASKQPGKPNLPAPTLGGLQVWSDERVRSGWRIQQNILSEHYRLLDPENIRRAWGSREETEAAFEERVSSGEIPPVPTELVVLVHGLGGWGDRFADLRQALSVRPATRSTISTIQVPAAALSLMLNKFRGF